MAQELKAYDFPVDHGDFTTTIELFYLKHQADKVIAELKAQKAQAEDDCAYWKTMEQKNAADNAVMAKQRAEALKRERHQKYKRCLAMSECREAQSRWCYLAANTLPPGVTATLYGKRVMVEQRRLFKRSERLLLASGLWKRLSEKFKEAK